LGGAGTVFDNFGTFLKSGHTGTTSLDSRVTLNNTGTVNIQNGSLDLGGAVSLTNGTLNFAITTTNTYGKLNLSGAAGLTGALGVVFYGYTPQVGDAFGLITYGSETGAFATYNLPSRINWQQTYGSTVYTLSVVGAPTVTLAFGDPVWTARGFNLAVSGPSGSNYTIQVSPILLQTNWETLTNFVSTFIVSPITDSAATNFSTNRFYRAIMR
jgi:hypothetical protein